MTRKLAPGELKGKWTREEDLRLREAVNKEGCVDWKLIAEKWFNSERSELQCLHRWHKVLAPGLVKGPWTDEEDNIIRRCRDEGMQKWSEIARHVEGRIGKQCRERWFNHLDPTIKKTPWEDYEDKILIAGQAEIGNKWTAIARRIFGRPENSVKNRWNSLVNRHKQAQKNLNRPSTVIESTCDYLDLPVEVRLKLAEKDENVQGLVRQHMKIRPAPVVAPVETAITTSMDSKVLGMDLVTSVVTAAADDEREIVGGVTDADLEGELDLTMGWTELEGGITATPDKSGSSTNASPQVKQETQVVATATATAGALTPCRKATNTPCRAAKSAVPTNTSALYANPTASIPLHTPVAHARSRRSRKQAAGSPAAFSPSIFSPTTLGPSAGRQQVQVGMGMGMGALASPPLQLQSPFKVTPSPTRRSLRRLQSQAPGSAGREGFASSSSFASSSFTIAPCRTRSPFSPALGWPNNGSMLPPRSQQRQPHGHGQLPLRACAGALSPSITSELRELLRPHEYDGEMEMNDLGISDLADENGNDNDHENDAAAGAGLAREAHVGGTPAFSAESSAPAHRHGTRSASKTSKNKNKNKDNERGCVKRKRSTAPASDAVDRHHAATQTQIEYTRAPLVSAVVSKPSKSGRPKPKRRKLHLDTAKISTMKAANAKMQLVGVLAPGAAGLAEGGANAQLLVRRSQRKGKKTDFSPTSVAAVTCVT